MRTIDAEWQRFAARVVPPGASETQRREMRRAFYAGAHSTLCLTVEISNLSEQAGVACLDGLMAEGEQFCRDVMAGIA